VECHTVNAGEEDMTGSLLPGLRSRRRKESEVFGEVGVGFLRTKGVGFFIRLLKSGVGIIFCIIFYIALLS